MKVNVVDIDEFRCFIERLKVIFGLNLMFVEVMFVLEEFKNCWVFFIGERRRSENFFLRW